MKRSLVYLGEPISFEAELGRYGSTPLSGLHVAAQRIAWGILMGERMGIDLDVEAVDILRRHGDHFCAHVAVALARRWQGREAEAERCVSRARELLPPGHPWRLLVPTEAEWAGPHLTPRLEEDEPDRVFRIVTESRPNGAPFGNRGVGRFLRMRSGELVYVNPVQLNEELAEEIRSKGRVTHVIAPSKYHSDHANQALEFFPKARLFGVEAHRGYPNVAHVRFDGYLSDDAPLFPGELEHVTLRGVDVGDAWLVDRASRTLITTDAVFLTRLVPGMAQFSGPFSTFYAWAWGVFDRVGIPSYQPAMWSNLGEYQASLRRALAQDFDHVASCHGPWRSIEGNGRTELAARLGWVLELGRIGAVGLLADFVRRHPGVFYRFVKEQVAARRGRAGGAESAAVAS